MSTSDFLFALALSDEAPFDAMLSEVATCVLARVGCDEDAAREVVALLQGALADGATAGLHQCEVRFRMRGGELQMAVTFAGGREWNTTYAIN